MFLSGAPYILMNVWENKGSAKNRLRGNGQVSDVNDPVPAQGPGGGVPDRLRTGGSKRIVPEKSGFSRTVR